MENHVDVTFIFFFYFQNKICFLSTINKDFHTCTVLCHYLLIPDYFLFPICFIDSDTFRMNEIPQIKFLLSNKIHPEFLNEVSKRSLCSLNINSNKNIAFFCHSFKTFIRRANNANTTTKFKFIKEMKVRYKVNVTPAIAWLKTKCFRF